MLTGVAAILLLLIALLAIPVTLIFQVSWQQTLQSDIQLLWLFGLVRIRLPSLQARAASQECEPLAQKISPTEHGAPKKKYFSHIIKQRALRRRIISFISDLWHAIHKRNLRLHMRIGLGDPADTGQLWAIVGPMAGMLANMQEASIEFEPEFFDTAFELDGSGNIRLIPAHLIYIIIGLLLSPSVWQELRKERKVD